MTVIFWILFGLIIGWIASIVDEPAAEDSPAKNMAIGVMGSIVGGVASRAFEEGNSYAFGNTSMMLAIMGSLLAILAVKGLKKRTTD